MTQNLADDVMNRTRDAAKFFGSYHVLVTPMIAQRTLAIGAGLLNSNVSGLTAE
jgi:hypothetical protein